MQCVCAWQASTRLRARLGEPRESLEKWDRTLEQSTTASLAAMQAYAFGVERRGQGSELASVLAYLLGASALLACVYVFWRRPSSRSAT